LRDDFIEKDRALYISPIHDEQKVKKKKEFISFVEFYINN
jgi:hypothetical protein